MMRALEARRALGRLLLLTTGLAGCAVAGAERGTSAPDPITQRAERLHADALAPALWTKAEAADRDARALEGEARAELLTEARLWREAAIAEVERQELDTRAQAQADRAEVDAERLRALRSERAAAEDEAERLAAGRLALEETARVLERAESEPKRRPRLSAEAQRQGVRALLARAESVLSAAGGLGAEPASLGATTAHMAEAEAKLATQPELALGLADRALFDAQAALGRVRGDEADAPSRTRLAEALHAAGYAAARTDLGLTAVLPFADARGALNGRPLARLCKLRGAFAVGALHVTLRDPQLARARRLAPALGARLGQLGCDTGPVLTQAAPGGQAPVLEVSFLAY